MGHLERIGTILSGIGAACAVPAAATGASAAVAGAAVALPALGAVLVGKTIIDTVREGQRDDCAAHIRAGIAAAQEGLSAEDAYSRVASARRATLEQALTTTLEAITAERGALRGLVVEAGLNGAQIAARLHALAPEHDPEGYFAEPESPESQFFRAVVAILWDTLRQRPGFYDILRSYIDEEQLARLARIEGKLDRALSETSTLSHRLGLREGLLMGVARRYLDDDPDDFEAALRGIEAALEEAARMRAADALPGNTGAAVDAVLARVAALNDAGRTGEATDALERELADRAERRAAEDAGTARLLDRAITQTRLTNAPEKAATYVLERLTLDAPADPFEALRTIQDEWYERGRDKGIAFDLEVAIALARDTITRAQNADQRGASLNDLGIALDVYGERETGTDRLEQAVTAYRAALEERTRDRVPLNWATTQNNLGNALQALGTREDGTERLDDAQNAFDEALKERTRERVPLNWAMTQGNIGLLQTHYAARTGEVARAEAAVGALTQALAVFRAAGAEAYIAQATPQLADAEALRDRLSGL